MALAALAILGHKSAHSFPMGPVIAEPTLKHVTNKITTSKCINRRSNGKDEENNK